MAQKISQYVPPTRADYDPADDPTIITPTTQGQRAKRDGLPREENLYVEDTPPHREWLAAYDAEDGPDDDGH